MLLVQSLGPLELTLTMYSHGCEESGAMTDDGPNISDDDVCNMLDLQKAGKPCLPLLEYVSGEG